MPLCRAERDLFRKQERLQKLVPRRQVLLYMHMYSVDFNVGLNAIWPSAQLLNASQGLKAKTHNQNYTQTVAITRPMQSINRPITSRHGVTVRGLHGKTFH